MKTFIHYLFILISVLTIASCENDLPFNVKDNPPKLVMNALINADSLTNIVFLNLTGKERVTHIQNATLEVRVNGVLTEQLRPLPIESEYCTFASLFHLNCFRKVSYMFRLKDVWYWSLHQTIQYHAWAEVTVPRRPAEIEKIDTLTIPFTESSFTTEFLRHKITFRDLPDENNYYRIIMDTRVIQMLRNEDNELYTKTWHNYNFVYREDIVLTDGQPSTENDENNGMFDIAKNVYGVFDDSRFKNSPYTMTVYVPRYIFQSYDGPYPSAKVDIIVHLLSITESEYYYLKALNLIDSDAFDDTINDPIKYPSNVHGGTGIVGISTEVSKVIHIMDNREASFL